MECIYQVFCSPVMPPREPLYLFKHCKIWRLNGGIHPVLLLMNDSGETVLGLKDLTLVCSHNIMSAFQILQLLLMLEMTSRVQWIDVARGSNPQLTEVVEKFPVPSETGLSCSLPSGFGRDAQGGVIDLTDWSLKRVFEVSPSG